MSDGSAVLYEYELEGARVIPNEPAEQTTLRLLKKKGAPIDGMCILTLSTDYNWQSYYEVQWRRTIVTWTEVINE